MGALCPLFLHSREYINSYIVQFAKENPQLTVYVRQRPGRHPRLVAEYRESRTSLMPRPHSKYGLGMRLVKGCVVLC